MLSIHDIGLLRVFGLHIPKTFRPFYPRSKGRSLVYAILVVSVLDLTGCSNESLCWPFCGNETSSGVSEGGNAAAEPASDNDVEGENTTADPASDRIALTGPNGGETFELIGSSQPLQIRWTAEGTFPILVDLYKSGTYFLRIEQNPNTPTGTKWTPPASLPPGDDYRIKVFSAADHSVFDFSDADFTLSISN